MRAKKSLGQNFLRDKMILKKIADFAHIEKTDTVVEVGPGEGSLTEFLLERAGQVIAIEKDGRLAKQLEENFKYQISNDKLLIINWDILNIENYLKITKLKIKNYVLVGNIPYYITGALFKKFLESENQPFDSAHGKPKSMTLVVQKEVAERIMARDGKESVLSISIKVYGEPEYGGIIKAGSFNPVPKVDSAIIAVRNINKKRFEELTPLAPLTLRGGEKERYIEQKFFEILKKGFAHKRKLLIKNLKTQKEVFAKCQIQEKARAENISVDNWICLAKNLL